MSPHNQFNSADCRRVSIGSASSTSSNTSSTTSSPKNQSNFVSAKRRISLLSGSANSSSGNQSEMSSSNNNTSVGLTRTDSFSSNSSLNSSVSSTASSRRRSRLQGDLEASRLYLGVRQDIDMVQQQKEAKDRKKKALEKFVEENTPLPLTYHQKVFSLKSIVAESERFQQQRGMKDLKMTVLGRAAEALGSSCPRNYFRVTKPSDVVANDIDLILAMDRSQLPNGADPMGFAAGAVLALPLWLPNRVEGNNPSRRVSPPEEELAIPPRRSKSSSKKRRH